MNRAHTQPRNSRQMFRGPVSFVSTEAVVREGQVVCLHDSVPGHLRKDGRRRDGEAETIPGRDQSMWDGATGGLVAVDQDKTGGRVQRRNSTPHGKHCRLEDIKGIDYLLLDHAEADGYRFGLDRQVESLALLCAEGLGVIHPLDYASRRKHHGGSHDRSGQRPPSGLINTRNEVIAGGTETGFYLCGRQRSDSLYVSLRSEIRAALPLNFRR